MIVSQGGTVLVLEPVNSDKSIGQATYVADLFLTWIFLSGAFPHAWIIVSFCSCSLFCPSKIFQPQKTKKQVEVFSEHGHFLYRMLPLEARDFSLSANPLAHCTPANDKAFSSQLPVNLFCHCATLHHQQLPMQQQIHF